MRIKKDRVLIAVDGGFWVSGKEVQAPEGFVYLTEAIMIFGFKGKILDIANGSLKPTDIQGDRDQEEWVIPVNSIKLIIPCVEIRA